MSQANVDVLDKVRKQPKHACIQRDGVPKTAPEAVKAKADVKVAELERKRDESYTGPEGLGRRSASKHEHASADHAAGAEQVRRGVRLVLKGSWLRPWQSWGSDLPTSRESDLCSRSASVRSHQCPPFKRNQSTRSRSTMASLALRSRANLYLTVAQWIQSCFIACSRIRICQGAAKIWCDAASRRSEATTPEHTAGKQESGHGTHVGALVAAKNSCNGLSACAPAPERLLECNLLRRGTISPLCFRDASFWGSRISVFGGMRGPPFRCVVLSVFV